jgi:general stress protein 26
MEMTAFTEMDVTSFAEIEGDFIQRVQRMVWCNVATIDSQGRPRSRVLHPIWEGSTGWIATRRHTPKANHLTHNAFVSLSYVADPVKPVYVDCHATWVADAETKRRVWNLFAAAAPPLGHDPAPILGSWAFANYGVLKLSPWRIELGSASGFGARRVVWHARTRRSSQERALVSGTSADRSSWHPMHEIEGRWGASRG